VWHVLRTIVDLLSQTLSIMFTKFSKLALTGSAALLALLAPTAAQNLGKPVLFNDGCVL
jgi:hypothetical protein